jgi:hypothetical protein
MAGVAPRGRPAGAAPVGQLDPASLDILGPVDSASPEESSEGATPTCSAKGCREPAAWALRWNNPKLHPPERRKTWLACDAHREYLTGFLDARGFLREVDQLP